MYFETGHGQIAVNVPNLDQLKARVSDHFNARDGFALATINLDHLVKLDRDTAFYGAYASQDLVVADGNPIVWLSKIAGKPVELLPGSELVVPLAEWATDAKCTIALFGSTQEALMDSSEALRQAVPGAQIVCMIAPEFGFDPTGPAAKEALETIEASGASLCFLALGAPKQERFAAYGREIAPSVGFASIGAGLDFLAGAQTRAPLIVRKVAMEWLWRMMGNPKRLAKRYFDCATIMPSQMRAAFRLRQKDAL